MASDPAMEGITGERIVPNSISGVKPLNSNYKPKNTRLQKIKRLRREKQLEELGLTPEEYAAGINGN